MVCAPCGGYGEHVYDLTEPERKRFRLLIAGLLTISFMATVWSTLLMIRSAEANRSNTASLLPLLERAEEFERGILNARIAFIYYATIQKPGSLDQGLSRYQEAQTALMDLHTLAMGNPHLTLIQSRIEALDGNWEAYRLRLQSILALVQSGTRSGPAYDQAIAEWAAQGKTLVNAARDVVITTTSLSRGQSNETGDMLKISTWIISANGVLCLLLSIALITILGRRIQPHAPALPRRSVARTGDGRSHSFRARCYNLAKHVQSSGKILAGLSGMLLLIIVVLGTGVAALLGIARLSTAQAETLRSQQALLVAESLRSLTFAVESDTRGFVFSGKDILLVSQQSQMGQAWTQFEKLKQTAALTPVQADRIERIQAALQNRFDILRKIALTRQQAGPDAVAGLIADGQSLRLKHDLQDALDSFDSSEYQSMVAGTLDADRAAAMSKTLILFAALPAALTLTFLSVAMAHLLSRSKKLQEQLTQQASHDVLTGLPNRLALEDRVKEMLSRARHERTHCAVLGIDLDHFKAVNDRYGHHEGDSFLRIIAKRLSSVIRAQDTLIRVGGDEFLCLIGGFQAPGDAEVVAKKLLASLSEPIHLATGTVKASASIGVAVYPDHGDNIEALTRHADDALYQAKEAGRNQFRCFEENAAKARLRAIEECLETALDRKLFHLVYQPQYNAQGTLRGFEALLRLTHPVLGPISPFEFIPLAERNRLIVPIGTWVLEQACSTYARWLKAGLDPGLLSLNVSAAQFSGSHFDETVSAALRSSGLSPERLELELTETTVMQDIEEAARQMNALACSGIRLAIDDFGTGYSSLEHLNRLPLSTLKIDRSFVRQLLDGNTSRPIIEAVVALGKALRLEIVAEGVETEQQHRSLSDIGCDHFQGFLFARPLQEPAAEWLVRSFSPIAPPALYADRLVTSSLAV